MNWGIWAVTDQDGVVLAVLHTTADQALERAGRLVDAAGLRDITHQQPTPELGWRYERTTKTWQAPEETP